MSPNWRSARCSARVASSATRWASATTSACADMTSWACSDNAQGYGSAAGSSAGSAGGAHGASGSEGAGVVVGGGVDGLGAGGGGGGGVVSSDEGVGSGVAGGVVWAEAATSVEARMNTVAVTAPAAARHEGVHIAGPGL